MEQPPSPSKACTWTLTLTLHRKLLRIADQCVTYNLSRACWGRGGGRRGRGGGGHGDFIAGLEEAWFRAGWPRPPGVW